METSVDKEVQTFFNIDFQEIVIFLILWHIKFINTTGSHFANYY
jgi:hypothetical protein